MKHINLEMELSDLLTLLTEQLKMLIVYFQSPGCVQQNIYL